MLRVGSVLLEGSLLSKPEGLLFSGFIRPQCFYVTLYFQRVVTFRGTLLSKVYGKGVNFFHSGF